MQQLSSFIGLFKNFVPYTGKYTSDDCATVESGSGNFMWHKMTGYQWYHQTTVLGLARLGNLDGTYENHLK